MAQQPKSERLTIDFKNDLYTIVDFQHVKPGMGGAFVRTKLKSVTNGKVIDQT
jgi:elongation factor P